jgi:hypothetical protein
MLAEPTSLAEWTMPDFAEADGGAFPGFIDVPNIACDL